MMTELYLIRHGESEWNRFSRYAGQRDVPLSPLGKEQAQRAAERLEGESLAAIYASPLQRALETANIIARHLGKCVIVEQGLAEINHGLWEGLTTAQVIREYPLDYTRWLSQPHLVAMPQGESLADVARRTEAVLVAILAKHHDGKVAICAHDAVLRVILLKSLGLGLEHFWKWNFENASLSVIQVWQEQETPSFRLARLNDTAHLDGYHSDHAAQAL